MGSEDTAKVIDIIQDIKVGMLTTQSSSGLLSRPLTTVRVDNHGDLWFFISADSDIASEVEAQPEVNVSFADSKQWVSVRGTASLVRDVAKKEEPWNPAVSAFARDGAQSPSVVLLRVESDTAEYWENPGGAASVVANWIRNKVTGKNEHPGNSGVVDL